MALPKDKNFHCVHHSVNPGQTFTGRSGQTFRVGPGGLITPNPTDPKDLESFEQIGSISIIEGPAPDLSQTDNTPAKVYKADAARFQAQLDEANRALRDRDKALLEMRAKIQELEATIKGRDAELASRAPVPPAESAPTK